MQKDVARVFLRLLYKPACVQYVLILYGVESFTLLFLAPFQSFKFTRTSVVMDKSLSS